MHRFYLPPEQTVGTVFSLEGREAHHASQVLRLRPGETVTVLNGVGQKFQCSVTAITRRALTLSVLDTKSLPPPPCQLTLLQAIPKGKTMETIIQKATELGAVRIIPLLSERSEVHLESEGAQSKQEKWRMIAVESIKQCGSPWLPQVDLPLKPAAFLERGESFELSLIGSLQADARHPRGYLQEFRLRERRSPHTLAVWVGPEGDFSPGELGAILQAGVVPISLGPLVLRSDTAAIYCLSVLNYECQWFSFES